MSTNDTNTHGASDEVEALLRASLAERAADVDPTPSLYEEVQRRAARAPLWRRPLVLAGVTAAAAAIAVVGGVLPGAFETSDIQPDILEQPEQPEQPADEDGVDDQAPAPGGPVADGSVASAIVTGGEVWVDTGTGLSRPNEFFRWIDLAVHAVDGRLVTVAGVTSQGDGQLLVGEVLANEDAPQLVDPVAASPNGGSIAMSPFGDGIAWFEGAALHVLPFGSGAQGVRAMPLEAGAPDDLEIEQWFYGADAAVVLATRPDGGVWSVPVDITGAFDTAPTDPPFPLDGATGAVDAALLGDLSMVQLLPAAGPDVTPRLVSGDVLDVPLPSAFRGATELELELTADGFGTVVAHDLGGLATSLALPPVGESQPRMASASLGDGVDVAIAYGPPAVDEEAQAPSTAVPTHRELGIDAYPATAIWTGERIEWRGGNKPDDGLELLADEPDAQLLAMVARDSFGDHASGFGVVDLAVVVATPDGQQLRVFGYAEAGYFTGDPAAIRAIGAPVDLDDELRGLEFSSGGEVLVLATATRTVLYATVDGDLVELARAEAPGSQLVSVIGASDSLELDFGSFEGGTLTQRAVLGQDGWSLTPREQWERRSDTGIVVRIPSLPTGAPVVAVTVTDAPRALTYVTTDGRTGTLPAPTSNQLGPIRSVRVGAAGVELSDGTSLVDVRFTVDGVGARLDAGVYEVEGTLRAVVR